MQDWTLHHAQNTDDGPLSVFINKNQTDSKLSTLGKIHLNSVGLKSIPLFVIYNIYNIFNYFNNIYKMLYWGPCFIFIYQCKSLVELSSKLSIICFYFGILECKYLWLKTFFVINSMLTLLLLAQSLKTYRHPSILSFLAWSQTKSEAYLFTEKACPLTLVRGQQSAHSISLGLLEICQALQFLHDKGNWLIKEVSRVKVHNSLMLDNKW